MKIKTNHYLYLSILCYIIPIVIFGHWNIYNSIYFPISLILFTTLIKSRCIDKGNSGWETTAYVFLYGMSLAFYGITVFGMSMEGSLVTISVYWGILVYIVFSLPFIIISGVYRERYQREYKELFKNNPVSFERDRKIDKILS